jgi:redox-sensitive bicupin YhaK (pirin superfamily)
MFDYAAPKEFSPTASRRGVGQHPHRGFETITIAFQGEVEHGDSVGNRDVIGPGDVQWMTAGRGIIHEEFHSDAFSARGGTFEMCQLWLNLPAEHKMRPPRYQPILHKDIPSVQLRPLADGDAECAADAAGTVRVIAGELEGTVGPADTFTPVELWDVHLPTAGAPVELEVPDGHNLIVFVRQGALRVGASGVERDVEAQGVALMERAGTTLRLAAKEADTRLLLLGGEPIDEPIAARGPFVMNTDAEIIQANRDFQSGRMGQ